LFTLLDALWRLTAYRYHRTEKLILGVIETKTTIMKMGYV